MQYILTEKEMQDFKFGIYRPENLVKSERGSYKKSDRYGTEEDCIISQYKNGKNAVTIVFSVDQLKKMIEMLASKESKPL